MNAIPQWPLKGEPYTVQSTALKQGQGQPGFAYFMEMGLGKTAVVYAEFVDLIMKNEVEGMIVVCPNSLKKNWHNEAFKWGVGDGLNMAIWPNLPEKNKTPWVLIINYEAFSVGGAKASTLLPDILKKYRTYVVLDESVQIKNYRGKRTKALLDLAPLMAYKRILSGAPVVQGPHDLWSQLSFVGALPGYNYYAFRNKFCKMGGFKGKKIVGIRNEETLNKLINRWGFRAKKKDWLNLPPKIFTTRDLSMSKLQQEAYNDMLHDFVLMTDVIEVTTEMVITQSMKLQQITSGFIIDDEGVVQTIEENPEKLTEIDNVLEEIDDKLLVPYHFRASFDMLIDRFPKAAFIKGGMSEDEIEYQKERFNEDDSVRQIFCQSASAKYGHTLLGSSEVRCSTTYFFENNYALDDRLQMEDRNHRIGQSETIDGVVYVDPICSPMDSKVIHALQFKLNIAEAVVDYIGEEQ